MGEGLKDCLHRAAIVAVSRARGELARRWEMEGRGLGLVEESAEVLTVEGIGPRRLGGGDRRGGSVLGEEQSKQKLEQGDERRGWAVRRARWW